VVIGVAERLDGIDMDDNTYTVECQNCDGTGKAFATRFSSFLSVCRECNGLREVAAP
jgi:DnaJ-class molecular chaperone